MSAIAHGSVVFRLWECFSAMPVCGYSTANILNTDEVNGKLRQARSD